MSNPLPGPIAYLTGEYPRATDTFIQREVAALRDIDFEIETCSIRRTGPEHIVGPEQAEEQKRTFHVLSSTAGLRGLRAQFRALREPGRYLRALRLAWSTAPRGVKGRLYNLIYFAEAVTLADHMRQRGVVHLHNHIAKASCTVAMLASALSRIPYSFTLHGPDIFFAPDHWRLDAKIERASFVACISEFCRSQAMLFSDQQHWNKLHIVHCGIDPSRYAGATKPPGQDLLFVGRLAAVKGVPVLFEALAEARTSLPNLRLTLIGDGLDRPALETLAKSMGLSDAITFAGYKNQTEVAEALAKADLLVLPSFAEGVPVVLMEAMAAGKPVVATQVGGVGELVDSGHTGHLVPPGDGRALAKAIRDSLSDPQWYAKAGAAGRAKVSHDFNAASEAAWLAILLISAHSGAARPGKRPER
ncbi:glycosyltransferase [Flavimaricola marinus]|uniref:Glycogen synthase n=1 Tax=Flavimaricola marinus TaxID=1819565 RepID=A0A238LD80_9RHOB|nr:glycosyltransferase [Flavimaricola marinus]SMY06880.1 Glycogen synthase [Flavimaricola marinus]